MLVKDGEGASLVIDVRVRGAKTRGDAELAARSIANSNLFKTAMAGRDPNWGRVMSALGAAGVPVQEDRIAIWYGEEQVAAGGPAPRGRPLGPGEGGAGQARGGDHRRPGPRLRAGSHLDLRLHH